MVRKSEFDKYDEKILEFLIKDCRTSFVKIGKILKLSEAAIRKRIKKLLSKKVIKKFTLVVDYKKIGKIESITGINVYPEYLLKVIEKLKFFKKIMAIYLTSGDHNVIVDIVADSLEELTYIHKELEKIEGVQKVYPSTIVEIIK